jgi:hypothetical protein
MIEIDSENYYWILNRLLLDFRFNENYYCHVGKYVLKNVAFFIMDGDICKKKKKTEKKKEKKRKKSCSIQTF